MIAFITSKATYNKLEKINETNRFVFYQAKLVSGGASEQAMVMEITSLDSVSHIVLEYNTFSPPPSSAFLAELTSLAKVLVLASTLSPYDIVIKNFYDIGITDVLLTNGAQLLKELSGILLQDGATHAETSESVQELSEATKSQNTHQLSSHYRKEHAATIAFAGALHRIGTTTQIFQMAYYLKSLFYKVAVIDLSSQNWVESYSKNQNCKKMAPSSYIVHNIPYYTDATVVPQLRKTIDILLFDYGVLSEIPDKLSFLEKDIQIVVCGYKPAEQHFLFPAFEVDTGNICYLFSFAAESEQNEIRASMADAAARTFFAGYSPNPWKYCGNDKLYQTLCMLDAEQETNQPQTSGWLKSLLSKVGVL